MKKWTFFSLCIASLSSSTVFAYGPGSGGSSYPSFRDDLTLQIPEIPADEIRQEFVQGFTKVPDVAQYRKADWSKVVGIAHNVCPAEACAIARENSEITFFFFTKGWRMTLETEDNDYRTFTHGDAVFFSGEPWWGSARGLADGYVKENS